MIKFESDNFSISVLDFPSENEISELIFSFQSLILRQGI